MPLTMSLAAVCQCFTLVALCTSIADPNWIQVINSSEPGGKQLIYGLAFTLHAAQNFTDTGPLGGVNGCGMWLLYALAALCYSTVLLSSSSFLLDFLGTGFAYPRLLTSLYISTVVFFLAIVGVCGACLYVIYYNIQKLAGSWTWTAGATGLHSYPGESFYLAILGLVFSSVAAIISVSSPWDPTSPPSQGGYAPVVEVDNKDLEEQEAGETETLTYR